MAGLIAKIFSHETKKGRLCYPGASEIRVDVLCWNFFVPLRLTVMFVALHRCRPVFTRTEISADTSLLDTVVLADTVSIPVDAVTLVANTTTGS